MRSFGWVVSGLAAWCVACGGPDASGDASGGLDASVDAASADGGSDGARPSPDSGASDARVLDASDDASAPDGGSDACAPVACYGGPDGTAGVGRCREGSRACDPGAPCEGEVTPIDEVCGNGLDDDCDGAADDGCVCTPGATQPCYEGPDGTAGVGACRAGSQVCVEVTPGTLAWGPCEGAIEPQLEACANAGSDDDCDGEGASGPGDVAGLGAACATGMAGACAMGAMECVGSSLECVAPAPGTETCNEVDDDCDGAIDDGFLCRVGETVGCTTGCGTTGSGACTAACEAPDASSCTPPPDVCNGVDDDCVFGCDDGFPCCAGQMVACTTSCGSAGMGVCTSGCAIPTGSACVAMGEICCNGMDDDCDGLMDGADPECDFGDLEWASRSGVATVSADSGTGVAMLDDGSAVVIGRVGTNVALSRVDASGASMWSRSYSGGTKAGTAIDAAPDGSSIVVTGTFSGTVTFATGVSLTSAGSTDAFVARYAADGTLAWVRRAGGSFVESDGIAVLPDGGALVTGYFLTPATFGPGEPGAVTLSSGRQFLARYAADGSLVWVRSTAAYAGRDVAAYPDGSSVVIGELNGTAVFGAGEAGETTLSSAAASRDVFVARYRLDGTLVWARLFGDVDSENAGGVDVLADGGALITGSFAGTVTFGAGDPGETTLTSAGGADVVLVRLDSMGRVVWARRAGGASGETGYAVAALPDASSFVVGRYGNMAATFGPGEACARTLSPFASGASTSDLFVARYDPSGALVWARRGGGTNVDAARGVDAIASGRVVVTGFFSGNATFAPGEPEAVVLMAPSATQDMFVLSHAP